jgi:hypothetical protein
MDCSVYRVDEALAVSVFRDPECPEIHPVALQSAASRNVQ